MRSFRNQDAFGRLDWGRLYKNLDCKPLKDISQIPNVVGVYHIYGRFRRAVERGDLAYVGQAAKQSGFAEDGWGISARAQTHLDKIKQHTQIREKGGNEGGTWMYEELSGEDVEEVLLIVSSILPFSSSDTDEASTHLPFLLSLIETIDIVFLDTLRPRSTATARRWGAAAASELRPLGMTTSQFCGLNQALPTKQNHRRFGIKLASTVWTPAECLKFIKTVNDNADQIYPAGRQGADWDFLKSRLSEQGIHRDKRAIMSLHASLGARSDSGMTTKSKPLMLRRWGCIRAAKKFLEDHGLVVPPKDDDDLYYHIPEMEEKFVSSYNFADFLKEKGFDIVSTRELRREYERVFQLVDFLLEKGVWEKILGKST